MCLSPEFFLEAGKREIERNKNGVSIEEAICSLKHYHTTVYPIATEMAYWLYQNWSLKQVSQLPTETKEGAVLDN